MGRGGRESQCRQQSNSETILRRKESSKREKEAQKKKKGIMEGLLGEDCKQRHKLPEANEVRNEEVPSSDNRGSQGAWSQLCQSNGRGSGNEESGHQCHLEISSPEETSDTIWPEKSPGILGDEENLREKEMVTEKPKKKKGEETDSEENKRQTRNDSSQKMSVRLRAHRQGEYQRGPQPSKVP